MSLLEDDNDDKRLSNDNYQRPVLTYTDKLTKEDIQEQLEEYEKVDDINKVAIGTNLKYFTLVNGKKKYRLGGNLINKSGLPNYVVLSNGKKQWSVQVTDTIFFKKSSIKDIKLQYIKMLEYKDKVIEKQSNRINELVKIINELKNNKKK